MRSFSTAIIGTLLVACTLPGDLVEPENDLVIISVVGSNDTHGELLSRANKGGLTTLSGYVSALRAARKEDGGAMLLIDAGDMWQGTLESNVAEGAPVVDAYNAMGYTAATIGNHDFDFGPAGELVIPQSADDDPQGALRLQATNSQFPILAANTIDSATGKPVAWDNVSPSVMIEVAGIKVGIVGVVTSDLIATAIAANTVGIEVASLSDAIKREATQLRADGAGLVIVTAHAGGGCEQFDDPNDLSSCDLDSEIVAVANALDAGLVDHIIGGHVSEGMAHFVNGIAITSAYSRTFAFSRVDFLIDSASGALERRDVFPPQINCPRYSLATNECEWTSTDPSTSRPAIYEGRPIQPDAVIAQIAERALDHVAELKSEPLGVILDTPITLDGNPESALANLFVDAVFSEVDADIVLHNVTGGIRATLPAGELTFGSVYEVYPFDNRLVVVDVSGAELRKVIERQLPRGNQRASFAGMRVFVGCHEDVASVEMILNNGHTIADDDRVQIATTDFLALGGDKILTPAIPEGGFRFDFDERLIRDLLVRWFRNRGGHLDAKQFESGTDRRWNLPELFVTQCQDRV